MFKISLMSTSKRNIVPREQIGVTYCEGYVVVDAFHKVLGIEKAFLEKGRFEMFKVSHSADKVEDKKIMAYFSNPVSEYNYNQQQYNFVHEDKTGMRGYVCLDGLGITEEFYWLKIESDI